MKKFLILFFSVILFFPCISYAVDQPAKPQDLGTDFSRYNGKLIGVSSGTVQERYLADLIPGGTAVYYDGFPNMAVALTNGKIDAFIMPYLAFLQLKKEYADLTYDPQQIGADAVGYIFGDSDFSRKLKGQFNEFLKKIQADGRLEKYQDMCVYGDKPYTDPVDMSDLTGENGTVRYGSFDSGIPFFYMGNEGYSGLDLLILHDFFSEYGYKCSIDNAQMGSILAGVSTGSYDMGGGGIAYTAERAESVDFSDAYMASPQVLVVKKDTTTVTGLWEKIKKGFRKTFIEEARWKLILRGFGTTCLIAFTAFVLGMLLGIGVCRMFMAKTALPRGIAGAIRKIMDGTPMVVILMILYYIIFAKARISGVPVAIVGFVILVAAQCGDLYYRSITGIDVGQMEAGMAIGLSKKNIYTNILIPQAMKSILPGFRSIFVGLLKGTAIVGYIAVEDLTKMSDIIRNRTYDAFFPLITTALIYFLLSWLIANLFARLGRKYDPKFRKREVKGVKTHA